VAEKITTRGTFTIIAGPDGAGRRGIGPRAVSSIAARSRTIGSNPMRRSFALLLASLLLFAPTLEARRRSAGGGTDVTTISTSQWLRTHAIHFATVEPETGFGDLEALRHVVGDARIVSLGEATHGTADFFKMKHRMLEYLVENLGFTVFGIEAALPETDAVNDYVLHGIGDPARAVAGMGFWTWNTQEVLDMALWMRAYNLRRGERPPVQFRGFDMQSSRAAMNRISAYLDRVDPGGKAQLTALWTCWEPFAQSSSAWSSRPAAEKSACQSSLGQLHSTLQSRRADYSSRSSAAEFEVILRYARVMQQDEDAAAARGGPGRDRYMAENVEWLANVAQPGEKLVLWAHNFHVSVLSNVMMGWHLRRAFPGRQMVVFGFAFDRGSFNAYNGGILRANRVESPTAGVEPTLRAVAPRMIVDLRDIVSTDARGYFAQPQDHWMIGSVFQGNGSAYRNRASLAQSYDALIWIEDTTASRLLPF
jgi:erythromycin esterase